MQTGQAGAGLSTVIDGGKYLLVKKTNKHKHTLGGEWDTGCIGDTGSGRLQTLPMTKTTVTPRNTNKPRSFISKHSEPQPRWMESPPP